MNKDIEIEIPIGKYFAFFTKQYIGVFAKMLSELPIERYFYPLYLIGKKSGTINQKELTNLLDSDKVTVNRIIDYLIEHKMVTKKINPSDKRSYNLLASEKAIQYVPIIEKAIQKTNEAFLSSINNHEVFEQIMCDLYKGMQHQDIDNISLSYKRLKK